MTKKRPTHESDAMSLFLSDSVAPTVAKKLLELEKKGLRGDQLFAATAISLSIERDPEFWKRFSDVIEFEDKLLRYLETLREEGKPVSMAFLRQVQQRYAEEIRPYRPKQWVIWKGAFDIELFELSKERYIIVKGQGFMFELPVE
jgi:hypothetical protein